MLKEPMLENERNLYLLIICFAVLHMIVIKLFLQALILMWLILVNRLSLCSCGSDQVSFQSD